MFPASPMLPQMIMQDLKYIVKTDGAYGINGIWINGAEDIIDFQGAILPLSTNDLKFEANGTHFADSEKLSTYTILKNGQYIIDSEGERFQVQSTKPYNPYASSLNIYYIRRAGVTEQ